MMEIQHPLLKRQLRRLLGSAALPPAWEQLVEVVDQAYQEADSDRRMLERSLDLSSQELLQANAELRAARDDLERRVEERTAELVRANEALRQEMAERQRIEERLRESQKMEAVGRLAGGIAHDFNNLLTVITGFTELLQARVEPGTPQWGNLEEVKRAAYRATMLTRQLLAFSRRQVLQPQVLRINETVQRMQQMLKPLIGEQVSVVTILAPDLGLVRADPSQIDQILMNLVVNARDAMPDGGQVTIETSNVWLGRSEEGPGDLPPGDYVKLSVRDTGCGMDEETLARIFEPFFTTKEARKGTGLGLSTVYGIAKQSGGLITVSSVAGRGASFDVYLPRLTDAKDAPSRLPNEVRVAGGRGETILLVEDENAVRKLARAILEARGYVVLDAATCADALARIEQHDGPIHLLLTDLVMPDGSGSSVAERLAKSRGETRVLYMSAYMDNTTLARGGLDRGTFFLQKPFTSASLERRVREVMDAPLRSPEATQKMP